MPKISLLVVMKGPVAIAGSIFLLCKKSGIKEFDLGGFNKKTSNGIKKFKEGLNGRIIERLGEYIYIGFF